MRKIIYVALIIIPACYKTPKVGLIQKHIEKPVVEFSYEQFEKPKIITSGKCYVEGQKKHEVICMLPSEFDKEINNYRIMLDIIKQYQISNTYYKEIK
jgi:hypothetical protein